MKDTVTDIIELIRELVECESPSGSGEHVNRFVDLLIARTEDIARPEVVDGGKYGDHLLLRFGPKNGARQILCVGHSDTVWPAGTLERMPFVQREGRLWGPGVLDMKAGLAFLIHAVRAVSPLTRPVTLLVVSDEEIGSPSSRALTEAEARKSECVLVLEPGTGLAGSVKTARKGVARYVVRVRGRAAHAGLDFEKGANAIVELARLIPGLAGLTDLERGITVNPGVIRGGTRGNVVPEAAELEVDVRVRTMAEAEEIDAAIRALRLQDARCSMVVEGGLNRPPMERTAEIGALYELARELAAAGGVELAESASGGGSDGSFTAALGIPTLDGLGAVGEGAHASHESILTERIADRVALLGALLKSI